ncbi:3-dehydroquinate synthase [Candidatus Neptunochlamydia vexilliferae]|nr:3-dehydroquinate synthase [Candidatus Neptunochlamydia vexilliferae]
MQTTECLLDKKAYFSENLLEDPHFLKATEGKSLVLVTDETVASLYPLFLKYDSITFPAGEKHKTRKTKETIENALLKKGAGRETVLIAFGGGVVTDLVGFVAATYMRGIPYLSVPTTLLGMVDASIGGKTGVNVKEGKNLIGATHLPQALFIDFSFLKTLPEKELLSGTAEVIKHGLIAKKSLLRETSLEKMVRESYTIKSDIVEKDLKESGERRILNFGHTIGHALEGIEEYAITHGEAVAIGMVVESFLSYKLGTLKIEDFETVYQLIRERGFPLKISHKVTVERMKKWMKCDKKSENGVPRFVTLSALGKVERHGGAYCTTVPKPLIDETLGWMIDALSS